MHFKRWGAVYILIILFLIFIGGQYYTQVHMVGEDKPEFWAAVFENWQSEMGQLIVQAVLLLAMGHLLFKAEKSDQERLEEKVDTILEKLDAKEQSDES